MTKLKNASYWFIDKISSFFIGITEDKELKIARKYLSGNDIEVKKMIELIKNHPVKNDLIDHIDDVYPAEVFEYTFTVETFLMIIK